MVTFIVSSPSGVVLHEWDVTRWTLITNEERNHILDEIVALGGVANTRKMRIWVGLRILDLLGAAKPYAKVKISAELTSVNPDPAAETQAVQQPG